jgi:tRNA uridine 5-carboxymethylaminomethyl modification enzyme
LLAGINAALKVKGREAWCPRRDEAYLGVLVDDLITRGVSEPYRMFTSRAEYRLSLREDNADARLTERGHTLGVVDEARWRAFSEKREAVERESQRLRSTWVNPSRVSSEEAERVLGKALEHEYNLFDLLRRPNVRYDLLMTLPGAPCPPVDNLQVIEQLEIQAKYQGYVDRQHDEVERMRAQEVTRLPEDLDYHQVRGLSKEVQQKLHQHRPETLGQAARIQGVTPAAIAVLSVYLKRGSATVRAGAG